MEALKLNDELSLSDPVSVACFRCGAAGQIRLDGHMQHAIHTLDGVNHSAANLMKSGVILILADDFTADANKGHHTPC
jgi:hypothetical protein